MSKCTYEDIEVEMSSTNFYTINEEGEPDELATQTLDQADVVGWTCNNCGDGSDSESFRNHVTIKGE